MSDPNVELGGSATVQPGSQLRRSRSIGLGVLVAVLLIGGIAASVIGIVQLAQNAGPAEDRIIARGTVAPLNPGNLNISQRSETIFETTDPGDVTVWLQLGGPGNVRESIVAGTACALTRGDGTTDEIRGSRQGNVVAVATFPSGRSPRGERSRPPTTSSSSGEPRAMA